MRKYVLLWSILTLFSCTHSKPPSNVIFYHSRDYRSYLTLTDSSFVFGTNGLTKDVLCAGIYYLRDGWILFKTDSAFPEKDDNDGIPVLSFCDSFESAIIRHDSIIYKKMIFTPYHFKKNGNLKKDDKEKITGHPATLKR